MPIQAKFDFVRRTIRFVRSASSYMTCRPRQTRYIQCLQLVRIRPYLYGIYVHCTDVRKLRSIIRKSCARSRSNPSVHRCTLGLEKETTRDLSRVVSVQQRTLVLVVMVCRNLQMRATRVSLRSSSYAVYCTVYF